jgi:hypothetical protein
MGYDKVVSLFVGQFHGGHATIFADFSQTSTAPGEVSQIFGRRWALNNIRLCDVHFLVVFYPAYR